MKQFCSAPKAKPRQRISKAAKHAENCNIQCPRTREKEQLREPGSTTGKRGKSTGWIPTLLRPSGLQRALGMESRLQPVKFHSSTGCEIRGVRLLEGCTVDRLKPGLHTSEVFSARLRLLP